MTHDSGVLCRASRRLRGARIALAAGVLLLSGCTGLFLHPETGHRWDPADAGIVYEDVWLEAADGVRVHAWLLPATEEPVLGQVLFLHGNAENISTHIASVYWLPGAGYDVLLLDYRGFGLSEGRADVAGIHRDSEAALHWMLERGERKGRPTVLLGQSLGGAVALTLAGESPATERLAGVVAEGAFSSYRRITREKFGELWLTWPFQWPLSLTVSDRFSPEDRVAGIAPVPLLLIAGEADAIVPSHHAERLHRRAGPPKDLWVVSGVGHNQAFALASVRRRLLEWMKEHIDDG